MGFSIFFCCCSLSLSYFIEYFFFVVLLDPFFPSVVFAFFSLFIFSLFFRSFFCCLGYYQHVFSTRIHQTKQTSKTKGTRLVSSEHIIHIQSIVTCALLFYKSCSIAHRHTRTHWNVSVIKCYLHSRTHAVKDKHTHDNGVEQQREGESWEGNVSCAQKSGLK